MKVRCVEPTRYLTVGKKYKVLGQDYIITDDQGDVMNFDKDKFEVVEDNVLQEYKYRFLASLFIVIATLIVFGSLVAVTYFAYK